MLELGSWRHSVLQTPALVLLRVNLGSIADLRYTGFCEIMVCDVLFLQCIENNHIS